MMEKILVIGDIHGRDIWKDIVKKEEKNVDRIIFIGDYFDTPVVSPGKILKNFIEIIDYKKANKEKVVLLLGNHDVHYLFEGKVEKCSGYDAKYAFANRIALTEAYSQNFLKYAYEYQDIIFSHAGVSASWLSIRTRHLPKAKKTEKISTIINSLEPEAFSFWDFDTSGSGEHPCQSPIWIRPMALSKELPIGYRQVVGHTVMNRGIQMVENALVLTDALSLKQYLTIVDGEFIINNL